MGVELTANGEGDVAVSLGSIPVIITNDPCLCSVDEYPPQAVPDTLGVVALSVFPRADQRAFSGATGTLMEVRVKRPAPFSPAVP